MTNYIEIIPSLTIRVDATIREAMVKIQDGGLGFVLVENRDRTFEGLITDGDIRRALLKGHGLEESVEKVHRPKTLTCPIGITSTQLASLFSEMIRVIPIIDENDRIADLAIMDRRSHLPIAKPLLGEAELKNVTECILTGWISSGGRFVSEFEKRCAAFIGTQEAISTSNGTTALHLALLAVGVGPGDEVIVPTLTFVATANAVTYTGARPVFVDSEVGTWNMDPIAVEKSITAKTKAVIAVHLYGHPVNLGAIQEICRKYGIRLIEDAAEAFGSSYHGKRVGALGDLGVFSFFGNKIITTGEGGMVVTDCPRLAEKCRLFRDHGMSLERRYWHVVLGYNYRMTNLQAAVGVAQIEKIDVIIQAKRRIAASYLAQLSDIPGISFQAVLPGTESVYWLNSIRIDPAVFGMSCQVLIEKLKQGKVDSRVVFPCLHRQPIYEQDLSLPIAEALSESGLCLPSDPSLRRTDIEYVAKIIRRAANIGAC